MVAIFSQFIVSEPRSRLLLPCVCFFCITSENSYYTTTPSAQLQKEGEKKVFAFIPQRLLPYSTREFTSSFKMG